ncbi:MAG: hypothetical protein WCT07_00715 [Candidatus Paceibacterota bacterium]|jgi:hypothetical protein
MCNSAKNINVFSSFVERNTPNPDNSCKTEGCSGAVSKTVSGYGPYGYIYTIPECNKCGTKYLNAPNVPSFGEEEFQKLMSKPYGI